MSVIRRLTVFFIAAFALFAACATPTNTPPAQQQSTESLEPHRKSYVLAIDNFWRIELPGGKRFDASGLAFDNGRLLTIDDGGPPVCEIQLTSTNLARLKQTSIFTWPQLTRFMAGKQGRFDFEGLARDEKGRVFACEEANRWIFQWDPATEAVTRLDIDWTPVRQYFSSNDNASFEGVAVGGGKLWVANERDRARIIEVDLASLKVVADFAPQPSNWSFVLHYSDLCWFKGRLFLLLRHHRVILEIDPATHDVLAEYKYHSLEDTAQHAYHKEYPTGNMEGLAVDDNYFWLVTDNNGFARVADSHDRRPTLFRCKRPADSQLPAK